MGNKSYPVNSNVLRQLREKMGWTQQHVGEELAKHFGTYSRLSPGRMANDYERIERSGSTSRKRLDKLVLIFGVSRAVLEGQEVPEPVEYEQQIRSLLQLSFDQGENETLKKIILCETKQHPTHDPQAALSDFASKIVARVENAQLTCNRDVLANLTHQTGLSEEELLRPANVNGYWLITASGRNIHNTKVIQGWPAIGMHFREIIGNRLEGLATDSLIRVYSDPPWYRIEIRHPRIGLIHIDIVRCKPERSGLRWQSPSWNEKWWLEHELTVWAKTTANFVEIFGEPLIPGDIRNLRFHVTEFNGLEGNVVGQTVIARDLNEIPEPLLEDAQQSGQTHQIAVNWLTQELADYLRPIFAEFPASRRHVSPGLHADITLWAAISAPQRSCDRRYRIELVEETTPGEFVIAPFREKDRKGLEDSINTWLE